MDSAAAPAAPAPAAAPRVVLVGELNPYGSSPHFDLWDEPADASGNRLRRILGLSSDEYRALGRRNLCRGKWSMREARVRAVDVAREHAGGVVVMCGRKVARAFGYGGALFSATRQESDKDLPAALVSIPHPSSRNLIWNDPRSVERVRDLLRVAVPAIEWGWYEDALDPFGGSRATGGSA